MNQLDIVRKHFDGEEGSFLLRARCELTWDWDAFRELTAAMYDVADQARGKDTIETWIAHGFWFCDTWIRGWTGHPDFPRPEKNRYENALELISDLAYFLFVGESPYEDNRLETLAKGNAT
jgi:hypothetical protein